MKFLVWRCWGTVWFMRNSPWSFATIWVSGQLWSSHSSCCNTVLSTYRPWGAGNPSWGQPNGRPFFPLSRYSCSIPNHSWCSFTRSITFLQLTRWFVSLKKKNTPKKNIQTQLRISCLDTENHKYEVDKKNKNKERGYLQEGGCTWELRRRPVCWGQEWTDLWAYTPGWGTCRYWSLRIGVCLTHQRSIQEYLPGIRFSHKSK